MTKTVSIIGFPQAAITKDNYSFITQSGATAEILHPDDFLSDNFNTNAEFLVSVYRDLDLRAKIISKITEQQLTKFTFIHSTAFVDPGATVCSGTFIGPFAFVGNGVTVGQDCQIAPYSMISHNTTIGNSCFIHPGSIIAGSSHIGNYCIIGLRSTIIDFITICDCVTVGAGALITKNIEEPGNYVGSPARRVK